MLASPADLLQFLEDRQQKVPMLSGLEHGVLLTLCMNSCLCVVIVCLLLWSCYQITC